MFEATGTKNVNCKIVHNNQKLKTKQNKTNIEQTKHNNYRINIYQLGHIHSMKYHTLRKSEHIPYMPKVMNFTNVVLNKRKKNQNNKLSITPF